MELFCVVVGKGFEEGGGFEVGSCLPEAVLEGQHRAEALRGKRVSGVAWHDESC